MAAFQFTGAVGKTMLVYHNQTSYLLIGTGAGLRAGAAAEKLGGKLFSALAETGAKRGWLIDHKLDDQLLADICFGAELASYHFDRYFTDNKSADAQVQLFVTASGLQADSPLMADRRALANGVFVARDLVFEPANKLFRSHLQHGAARWQISALRSKFWMKRRCKSWAWGRCSVSVRAAAASRVWW